MEIADFSKIKLTFEPINTIQVELEKSAVPPRDPVVEAVYQEPEILFLSRAFGSLTRFSDMASTLVGNLERMEGDVSSIKVDCPGQIEQFIAELPHYDAILERIGTINIDPVARMSFKQARKSLAVFAEGLESRLMSRQVYHEGRIASDFIDLALTYWGGNLSSL